MEYKMINEAIEFIKSEAADYDCILTDGMPEKLINVFHHVDLLVEEFESESVDFEYERVENQCVVTMRFDDIILENGGDHKFFDMVQMIDGMCMYFDEGQIVIVVSINNLLQDK